MRFLILNGPNLNLLGTRRPDIYGSTTYPQLVDYITAVCRENDIEADFLQSNHEGALVDAIQAAKGVFDGIVINPAAYTHTSIAILDALEAVSLPAAEVHISDIMQREGFRHVSYAGKACQLHFIGQGIEGYKNAVLALQQYILQAKKETTS